MREQRAAVAFPEACLVEERARGADLGEEFGAGHGSNLFAADFLKHPSAGRTLELLKDVFEKIQRRVTA